MHPPSSFPPEPITSCSIALQVCCCYSTSEDSEGIEIIARDIGGAWAACGWSDLSQH
jgi:hypothetical protein